MSENEVWKHVQKIKMPAAICYASRQEADEDEDEDEEDASYNSMLASQVYVSYISQHELTVRIQQNKLISSI